MQALLLREFAINFFTCWTDGEFLRIPVRYPLLSAERLDWLSRYR